MRVYFFFPTYKLFSMDNAGGKLVLVVEDDADQSNAMLKALQESGFSPMCANGVREALFRLKNQKFSLVVLDLLLGEESGQELIDLVRARADIPNTATPILVVSANLSKEALKVMAGKVQGAMVKPIDMSAFVANAQRLAK